MINIMKKAREKHIKKYGVDPANPKVENVNGVLLPKEYVKELVKKGKLNPGSDAVDLTPKTTSTEGPWGKNNKLYLWIFAEKGSQKPTQAYLQDTLDAYGRFYAHFSGTLYYYHVTNYWDASDVSPATNTEKLLDDLGEDTNWLRYHHNDWDPVNDIVIGWVNTGDHNGRAEINGFFSVGCTYALSGANWPHDSIAQHEISHNFNTHDEGTWCWEHETCIMNYCWAQLGTNYWCGGCDNTVYGNINGLWE